MHAAFAHMRIPGSARMGAFESCHNSVSAPLWGPGQLSFSPDQEGGARSVWLRVAFRRPSPVVGVANARIRIVPAAGPARRAHRGRTQVAWLR